MLDLWDSHGARLWHNQWCVWSPSLITDLPFNSSLITDLPFNSPLITDLPFNSPLVTDPPFNSPLITDLPFNSSLILTSPLTLHPLKTSPLTLFSLQTSPIMTTLNISALTSNCTSVRPTWPTRILQNISTRSSKMCVRVCEECVCTYIRMSVCVCCLSLCVCVDVRVSLYSVHSPLSLLVTNASQSQSPGEPPNDSPCSRSTDETWAVCSGTLLNAPTLSYRSSTYTFCHCQFSPSLCLPAIPEDGIKVEEERNEDKDNPNERITRKCVGDGGRW